MCCSFCPAYARQKRRLNYNGTRQVSLISSPFREAVVDGGKKHVEYLTMVLLKIICEITEFHTPN